MTNINPIKFGVTGANQYRVSDATDNSKRKDTQNKQAKEDNQMSSNDVLNFMSAQNADLLPVKSQKTVDVSKYVSKEQEARIAEFMKGFEADFDKVYDIASNEFPDLSDKAAGDISLAYINSAYSEE